MKILLCFIILLIGCNQNNQLFQQSIEHYHADGGIYFLYDIQKRKIADKLAINFDLNQVYTADLPELELKQEIKPEQLLQTYIEKIKNDCNLLKILRKNVLSGALKRANVEGVEVFGLGATSENYQTGKIVTTFIGHFVTNGKTYVLLVILDNPKPLKETYGFRTASWNVAPITSELITALTRKK